MKKIMSLVLILFAVNHHAWSANCPGTITISPAVGYYFFANQRNIQNTTLPNIAIAYNFNPIWAIELGAGSINTNKSNSSERTVKGWLYTLDGIYRFSPPCRSPFLQPYLFAGMNVLNLNATSKDAPNQAGINAGVGTQIFIDRYIAFRTDVRDVLTFTHHRNELMVNLGMSFFIGG